MESKVLEGAKGRLWITVTHGLEPVKGRLMLRLPAAEYVAKNLETGVPYQVDYANGTLQVDLALPAQGVLVLLISS